MDRHERELIDLHEPDQDVGFDEVRHDYSIGGVSVPGVTFLLKSVGFDGFGKEWHLAKGKAVHVACQYLDEGCLDWATVGDEIVPYISAYERFKLDTGFKPIRIEEPLFNSALRYGGTLDREGTWNMSEGRVLIDFKSGAISPWTGLQLAGYDLLLPALKLPRERYALQLKPDGTYNLKQFKDHQDKSLFLGILATYHWRQNHGV